MQSRVIFPSSYLHRREQTTYKASAPICSADTKLSCLIPKSTKSVKSQRCSPPHLSRHTPAPTSSLTMRPERGVSHDTLTRSERAKLIYRSLRALRRRCKLSYNWLDQGIDHFPEDHLRHGGFVHPLRYGILGGRPWSSSHHRRSITQYL